MRKTVAIFAALCALATLPASGLAAQSGGFSTRDEAVKQDGRFIARVANYDSGAATGGFVHAIYLTIEWWGLANQPVEQYAIRWDMGDRVSIPDGKGGTYELYVPDLRKYPDLHRRFAKLRPVNLILAVDVTLYEPRGNRESPEYPREYPIYYEYADFATATKKVKRSPHLMIADAGEAGEDFLPSSPQSWADFLEWRGGSVLGGDDPDAKARNTLRRTRSIVFGSPQVEKIDLPEAQMRLIYEEYRRREKAGEEQEEAARQAAEDKLAQKMRQIEAEKAAEAKRRAEEQAHKDAEARLARKMKEIAARNSAEEKLRRKMAGLSRSESQAPKTHVAGHIRQKNARFGVVDAAGNALIPFGKYRITSYSNGVAQAIERVAVDVDRKEAHCFTGPAGQKLHVGYAFYKVGEIDRRGQWSASAKIIGSFYYGLYYQRNDALQRDCRRKAEELNRTRKPRGARIISYDEIKSINQKYDKLLKSTKEMD